MEKKILHLNKPKSFHHIIQLLMHDNSYTEFWQEDIPFFPSKNCKNRIFAKLPFSTIQFLFWESEKGNFSINSRFYNKF